ncbi:hypothetical protein GT347_15915 [Xylophilus rhododendri]|uniref:Uncharacterized protein n=1 Tax=Xylophilus rhododendri TaxID=2697032 RepID=A0A857J8I6_9BURK|nr:hypothetical protein [Xylophilus rhododendri]QHI99332.1 hypothetical protein GT347_15915 [Xylophilus rhododendri]
MIDFRSVFLPYCVLRLMDGNHVVLNRNEAPAGLTVEGGVKMEDHPVRVRLQDLRPESIAAASVDGSGDAARILLYDDNSIPTDSAEHWAAYGRRLQALAALGLEAVREGDPEFVVVPDFPVFKARAR